MSKNANEPWAAWAEQMQKWMATPGASNPFGLPSNPMASGFGNPFAAFPGGAALDPQTIMKSIDPDEIDRRIQEMRAVENWLKFSISTLEMSIKTMEMQRDAYASLRSMSATASDAAKATAGLARKTAKRAARTRSATKR